ncbi:MAG: 2-C-methyl-D-erythritol 4-phosphate cytidylyltransferase [Betaproteobacteria bacterium]|nr:2-C-methyl-D-erythritol 4-phosphate cytidylyltransferase [Betaproteobacteria bacterium]
MQETNVIAILPAAGTGTRLGDARPKQYLDIGGRPMIRHAIEALARVRRIGSIVVILSESDAHWDALMPDERRAQTLRIGGATRGETVRNGLRALAATCAPDTWMLVHDAARPCIRAPLIEQFLDELEADPVGGLLALPLADTLKSADGLQRVAATLPRENVWRAQTPQMFRLRDLLPALEAMPDATDEAQAIEARGLQPKLVLGDSANIKVTYAPDLELAEMFLRRKVQP